MYWSTRWFKVWAGRANWLAGSPWAVRVMIGPAPARPTLHRQIASWWDGWVTREGLTVNCQGYQFL